MKLLIQIIIVVIINISILSAKEVENNANLLDLIVYKTPSCGCCNEWLSHIKANDIKAETKNYKNISPIKTKYAIKREYRSCHTAVNKDGFVFEGHIPAKYIKQFISEKHPNAIGLSVPGMPIGSPGMEVAKRFNPYKILLLLKDGTSEVYAEIKRFEDQY